MPLILGTLASAVTANAAPPAFESIGTYAITSTTASVTFSSIPQTYKHLQIRGVITNPANGGFNSMRMNGDSSTASYIQHFMYANTPTVAAGANLTGQSSINVGGLSYGISATSPRIFIVDLLDYKDTNKNSVVRIMTGEDENGAGEVTFQSGTWLNTAAVTSLTFLVSNSYTAGSHIALYGVL